MAIDCQLMASFVDGRFQARYGHSSALWRFYAWHPFAVTLGYNQEVSGIDGRKCRDAGIDIVRRPTGGRAVFHAEEFTYSFFSDSLRESAAIYRDVHETIRLALEGLGICAEFCRSTLSGLTGQPGQRVGGSVSCFTASARHELQVNGRKLVGSAQRRTGNALLQHGSLPISPRHKELCDFIASSGGEDFLALRDELERKAISLEEILGYRPPYDALSLLMTDAVSRFNGFQAIRIHSDELDEFLSHSQLYTH